tara:strand:- start:61 stop:825 length:765 start_codon:yes stop_codon:yes gene_type:complete
MFILKKMSDDYQHSFSELMPSMFESSIRIQKANKTINVLKDFLNDTSNLNLLDIGSSSGIMTNQYAKFFNNVIGLDLDAKAVNYANENFREENLKFICSPIEESNLPENSFDVVTCSQIYEHVPSDKKLMDEIFKLLKPGGVCYFAATNRFKIIEPHYKLPFLSFFPKSIANRYIRIFTNHEKYYENLKSLRNLKKLVFQFEIEDYTLKIIENPSKFSADEMLKENTLKYYLVNMISRTVYFLIPTYIWILRKP